MEMESGIHKEIWEIADEPSLRTNLEKLLWQLMGTRPLLEITRESEPDAILKHQIECERTGHPRGHVPLLEAICSRDPAAARAMMIQHLVGTDRYSNETTEALKAAFGLTKLPIVPNQTEISERIRI